MGHQSTQTNQTIDIHPETDWLDNGWSIEGNRAVHDSCNEGYMRNRNMVTEEGQAYKVTYTITGRTSGSVRVIVGGVNGTTRSANGTYTQTITALDNSGISFWSDGDLTVSSLIISSGYVDALTLAFDGNNMKWVGYYSFAPEGMTKFINGFYSWRDGRLWEHNENEIRNSFYGVEYPSIITFYVNIQPTAVKTLSSIRLNGNKRWAVTEVLIEPREGKSEGQRSRIKSGNFKNLQGQFFADFLRDMNDSRFGSELQALLKGAVLQGTVAKITIETTETTEVRLVSVDVLGSVQQYSY